MIETQSDKKQRNIRILTLFFIGFVITFCAVFLYSPTFKSHADESGVDDGTPKVSAKMNSIISLTVDSSVLIEAMPLSSGYFASSPMNISIRTNSPSGYKILMSAASGTAMTSDTTDDIIESVTEAVTSESMPSNTWGYSLDNTTFLAIPTSDNPVTIREVNVRPTDDLRNTTINYGAKIDSSLDTASYKDILVITAVVNDVPEDCEGFYCIDTMQEMTTAVCAQTPTPNSSAYQPSYTYTDDHSYVPYKVLRDTRDNQDYLVAKFVDGNCWMVQNMNLELDKNVPLTNDKTEIAEASWTPAQSTIDRLGNEEDPETGDWIEHIVADDDNTGVASLKPFTGNSGWADFVVSYEHQTDREVSDVFEALENAHDDTPLSKAEHVGVLYTYNAAMHVCPKGWQLPNGTLTYKDASVIPSNQRTFAQLLEAYGYRGSTGTFSYSGSTNRSNFLGHNQWNYIPSGYTQKSASQTFGRLGADSYGSQKHMLWTNHKLDEEYSPTEVLEVDFYGGFIALDYKKIGSTPLYSARCVAK